MINTTNQTQPTNQTASSQAVVTTPPVNPQEVKPSKLKSLNKRRVALLLIILLVGVNLILGGYYLIFRNRFNAELNNQEIKISNIKIEKSGFIRVFVEDKGKQGKLVGTSSLLEDNYKGDLTFKLSTQSEKGKTYLLVYEPKITEAYLVFGAKIPDEVEKEIKILAKVKAKN
ncbi:hypothetical protein A2Z22_02850 [Candidatus Woesebacteria bacterium RBG_16_34_12]|uniref:Uncharacterized protein n=1 Tax=Candidatus Woesebacteria bacterium RBG_16_34_12 TaxID=1802480 RepID=A0A1F7X6V2_9BACT|nr:MAG: hypothetical protein A2Z22_02850 [Candidatus Woesebacteria bacterium RBG_16_34_12]